MSNWYAKMLDNCYKLVYNVYTFKNKQTRKEIEMNEKHREELYLLFLKFGREDASVVIAEKHDYTYDFVYEELQDMINDNYEQSFGNWRQYD